MQGGQERKAGRGRLKQRQALMKADAKNQNKKKHKEEQEQGKTGTRTRQAWEDNRATSRQNRYGSRQETLAGKTGRQGTAGVTAGETNQGVADNWYNRK